MRHHWSGGGVFLVAFLVAFGVGLTQIFFVTAPLVPFAVFTAFASGVTVAVIALVVFLVVRHAHHGSGREIGARGARRGSR